MKRYIFMLLISINSYAGSFTNSAVPTGIDVERGNGFMVYGAFGNTQECSVSNKFYVLSNHPQYKEIYSAVLAAFSSGKKVTAFISKCEAVAWYTSTTTTYNIVSGGSVYFRN